MIKPHEDYDIGELLGGDHVSHSGDDDVLQAQVPETETATEQPGAIIDFDSKNDQNQESKISPTYSEMLTKRKLKLQNNQDPAILQAIQNKRRDANADMPKRTEFESNQKLNFKQLFLDSKPDPINEINDKSSIKNNFNPECPISISNFINKLVEINVRFKISSRSFWAIFGEKFGCLLELGWGWRGMVVRIIASMIDYDLLYDSICHRQVVTASLVRIIQQ